MGKGTSETSTIMKTWHFCLSQRIHGTGIFLHLPLKKQLNVRRLKYAIVVCFFFCRFQTLNVCSIYFKVSQNVGKFRIRPFVCPQISGINPYNQSYNPGDGMLRPSILSGNPRPSSDQSTQSLGSKTIAGWWFQIFVYVHPYLGKIPILTIFFSDGLKLPTSTN